MNATLLQLMVTRDAVTHVGLPNNATLEWLVPLESVLMLISRTVMLVPLMRNMKKKLILKADLPVLNLAANTHSAVTICSAVQTISFAWIDQQVAHGVTIAMPIKVVTSLLPTIYQKPLIIIWSLKTRSATMEKFMLLSINPGWHQLEPVQLSAKTSKAANSLLMEKTSHQYVIM